MSKSIVSIVKGTNAEDTVERSIILLGGMEKIVKKGDCVIIKPNFTVTLPPETGVATDPKILEVLVNLSFKAGAKKVVIAEGSGSSDITEMDGLGDIALRTGAEIVDINKLPKKDIVKASITNAFVLKEIPLPRLILEADVVINVPKMKTTGMITSLGLKNLIGTTPGKGKYAEWHNGVPRHPFIPAGGKAIIHSIKTEKGRIDGLMKAIIDLNQIIHCNLTVIDGIYAMEGAGPIHGASVKMGVVIAGEDIVAVEAVGNAVMGFNPAKLELIKLAVEANLGIGDLNHIEIRGDTIDQVYRGFEPGSFTGWKYYLKPLEPIFIETFGDLLKDFQ